MILPTVRASFGRSDAIHLVDLLARRDPDIRKAALARLEQEGPDSLLDDPRVRSALLTDPDVKAPPSLVFYVLVRQALLEGGIDSAATADFVTSMVISFGSAARAYRIFDDSQEEFHYLVDLIDQMRTASESPQAVALGVDKVFGEVARHFTGVRTSLNLLSDRYMWPGGGDPVNRLLREVTHQMER